MGYLLITSRILRVEKFINPFLHNHYLSYLELSEREWTQIKYLIDLTKPFCHATKVVSSTKRTTINRVLPIYNKLLEHLERARRKLAHKKVNWKTKLADGISESWQKLSKYYSATDSVEGHIYGHAILLDPAKKKSYWNTADWSDETEYPKKYWQSLRDIYDLYYAHQPVQFDGGSLAASTAADDFDDFINGVSAINENEEDEFTKWENYRKYVVVVIVIVPY